MHHAFSVKTEAVLADGGVTRKSAAVEILCDTILDARADAFTERLAAKNTFVLPGTNAELPGYVRISLTANDAMVDQGLRAFASVR